LQKSLRNKFGKALSIAEVHGVVQATEEFTKSELLYRVIPASEARQESFRRSRKDSGQAGMTDCAAWTNDHVLCNIKVYSEDMSIILGESY